MHLTFEKSQHAALRVLNFKQRDGHIVIVCALSGDSVKKLLQFMADLL